MDNIVEAINDADFDVDFKGFFTLLKAANTIRATYGAAQLYRGDDAASPLAGPAVRLLGLNALLVALVALYKLTRRDIAPLFALRCLGDYSCFLTFAALAGFGSHPAIRRGRRGDRRIGIAIWAGHVLHAAVLVAGWRRAGCEEESAYPVSFVMSDGLFLASYCVLLYVKKRGFDIRDLKKGEDDEASEEDLELFEAQVSVFFKHQRILVVWHAVEMILGYGLLPLECNESHDAWVLNNMAGKGFLLLHTYGVKQSLGVSSKVFFKTVKKFKNKHKNSHGKAKKEN